MKISPINNLYYINSIKQANNIVFGKNSTPPNGDTFIKSNTGNNNCSFFVKKDGIEIPIHIEKSIQDHTPLREFDLCDFVKFTAKSNDDVVGFVEVASRPHCLYVLRLESTERKTHKGIGTGLLKQAVMESKKRGLNGRLELCAANERDPSVFYYKNNLRIAHRKLDYNIILDYCARNNVRYESFAFVGPHSYSMALDEKGANDLLNNKRNYKDYYNWEHVLDIEKDGDTYCVEHIKSNIDGDNYVMLTKNRSRSFYLKFLAKITKNDNKIDLCKLYDIANDPFDLEVLKRGLDIITNKN